MNFKKNILTSSYLILAGSIACLSALLITRDFSSLFAVIMDFLPDFLLGIFLIYVAFNYKSISLKKVKDFWSVLFIVCVINMFLMLFFNIIFDFYLKMFGSAKTFLVSNFLIYLPFSRVISDTYCVIYEYMAQSILICVAGDVLVFAGFVIAYKTLSDFCRAKNEENSAVEQNTKKMTGFFEAVKICLKKYFTFRGYATRAEYWFFYLFSFLINSILSMAAIFCYIQLLDVDLYTLFMILICIGNVILLLPGISVKVRRMHDAGYSGIFSIIPVLGFVLTLMPSKENSSYRTEEDIHSGARITGKVFAVIYLILYMIACGCIVKALQIIASMDVINRVHSLSTHSNSQTYSDDDFDETYDYDEEDEGGYVNDRYWWDEDLEENNNESNDDSYYDER